MGIPVADMGMFMCTPTQDFRGVDSGSILNIIDDRPGGVPMESYLESGAGSF